MEERKGQSMWPLPQADPQLPTCLNDRGANAWVCNALGSGGGRGTGKGDEPENECYRIERGGVSIGIEKDRHR